MKKALAILAVLTFLLSGCQANSNEETSQGSTSSSASSSLQADFSTQSSEISSTTSTSADTTTSTSTGTTTTTTSTKNSSTTTTKRTTTTTKKSTTTTKKTTTTTTKKTTTTTKKTTTTTKSANLSSYQRDLLNLVNQERAKAGKKSLSYRADLQNAANTRVGEIVTNFSHTRPNGKSWSTILNGISFKSASENIGYGQPTAQKVMDRWMNSDAHRNNILSSSFTGIAIGHKTVGETHYWVMLFIG